MNNPYAEKFTKEEKWFIEPFFTNLDRNVFAAKYLPSEILGALASRYSRSTKGVRRLFYDEYIKPIINPKLEGASSKEIKEVDIMKNELISFVDYLHKHGGWEAVVNSKRARDFFARWLAAYGDDSIAQMAGAHLFLENISQVATKVLEDFRIGFAPLEKSTRYVAFDTKVGGRYMYYVEPDLAKSKFGKVYIAHMNMLFRRYATSMEPLAKYLRKKFPQEKDQSDRAYAETIKAKTCDVLRAYLPIAVVTNVGFFGVGQAFEYVITKCLATPLAEIRDLAKQAQTELLKVIPSMVDRPTSPRGRIYQRYVRGTEKELERLTKEFLPLSVIPSKEGISKLANSLILDPFDKTQGKQVENDISAKGNNQLVELVEWDEDAEDRIIASILYKYSNLGYSEIKNRVTHLSQKQKLDIIRKAVAGRQVRQHRLIRAFENTYYKFDIVANVGAYRDLHRHRMLTQERQRFTTKLGYDIPPDLVAAKLEKPFVDAAKKIDRFYAKISKKYPDQAQYIVMNANKVRWYQWENLRELGWEAELRTGPQGHPDYRVIEQKKVEVVREVHPTLVEALKFVDFKEYDLARRESEKKIDRKLGLVS